MKSNILDLSALTIDAFKSHLPIKPDGIVRQIINRAVANLPHVSRGHYFGPAILVVVAAIACLAAGVVGSSTGLTFVGALGVGLALAFCLMIQPARIEDAVLLTQQQTESVIRSHALECERQVKEFAAQHHGRQSHLLSSAISAGSSLEEVSNECCKAQELLRQRRLELERLREEAAKECAQRATAFRNAREARTTFFRLGRARFLPWIVRREARDALAALARWNEASIHESEIKSQITAASEQEVAFASVGHAPSVSIAAPTKEATLPPWRGIPLPDRETIRAGAIAIAQTNLTEIRGKVMRAVAERQEPADAVKDVLQALFSHEVPWPEKLSRYVAGMNGELPGLVDPLVAAAAEWLPTNRAPGRKRHRKIFLFADDVSHSPILAALRERLPDTAGVIGIENPSDELLLVAEEHNLSLSEVPEALACLASFRAASSDRQESIVLAVQRSDDITHYFPERGNTPQSAEQLLAISLVLGVVVRRKDQRYRVENEIFARGFAEAAEVFRQDHRLAESVEGKIGALIAQIGVAETGSRLTAARTAPDPFAPADSREAFIAGLDQAISDLHRN